MKATPGQRLYELMKYYELTARDISVATDIPKSSMSMYLSDKRKMKADRLKLLADKYHVNEAWLMGYDVSMRKNIPSKGVLINVLGRVAAGIPIDAINEIIDQEEISSKLAQSGDYFGLKIKGDSMSPQIMDGDTVIVRKQEDAESDQIVIAIINGNDGVCKKLRKIAHGLMLISLNPQYDPMVFDYSEIDSIPVKIIGKVVEIRRKL